MTETKTCNICGDDLQNVHGNVKYCDYCIPPKNANGGWQYQYWIFIMSFTKDELRALVTCRKNKCKAKSVDIKKQRTIIKLLTIAYNRKCGRYASTDKIKQR